MDELSKMYKKYEDLQKVNERLENDNKELKSEVEKWKHMRNECERQYQEQIEEFTKMFNKLDTAVEIIRRWKNLLGETHYITMQNLCEESYNFMKSIGRDK